MTMNLINEVKRIAVNYFEAENIYVPDFEVTHAVKIITGVIDSLELNIIDAEVIAAGVIDFVYQPEVTLDYTAEDFAGLHEFYFPSEPLEMYNYSVEEIRDAIRDEEWR